MTPENFCYWLQGMFELTKSDTLSKQQITIIKNHLQLVFNKVTPDVELEESDEISDFADSLKEMMDDIEKQRDTQKIDTNPWVLPSRPYPVFPEPYDTGRDPDRHAPVITCKVKSETFC